LTGGFDEGYGSASSSQAPTEGSEDERVEPTGLDGSGDSGSVPTLGEPGHAEIPRNTRPFRAWGAAHERDTGPSVWERFAGWLRGLFTRKKSDSAALDAALRAANESGPLAKSVVPSAGDFATSDDEFASSAVLIPPARDDFAAEVEAEAPPAADDFGAVEEFQSSASSAFVAPSPQADPLWDEPVVADAAQTAPPALEAQDFADVWTPPSEVVAGIAAALAEPAPVEPPKKRGFFARLFSRKKDQDAADEHHEAAAAWASEVEEIHRDDDSALEPADADFADSPVASAVPTEDDFASESVPPSIEHSAQDAANLAAFLGTSAPAMEEPMVEIAAIEETTFIEEAPAVEEALPEELPEEVESPVAEAPAVADDAIDESLLVDPLPEPEVVPEPPPTPFKQVDTAKKPGFFSALLRRVSRSQFVPKVEPELEPEPVEAAADADVTDFSEPAELPEVEEAVEVEEVVEVEGVIEVEEVVEASAPVVEEPAAPDHDALFDTLPSPMAPVPPMMAPPVAEVEFQATQPFPAFRDARDDFADEEKPQEPARPTEKVEIPAFDDGEKTDEFQAVPIDAGETLETRQVAGFWGRIFGAKAAAAAGDAAAPVSGEAAATPAPDEDKTPFVLAKFRTFYNEIIRDKHQKSDVISGFATAVMGSAGATDSSDPEFAAQLLSKRLSEMLELQAAESNWTGGDAAKYYPEAQYAMVALADETFATTDWPGRPSWHKYMLEPRMYGTRGAELEFFKRIDKLLKEAPQEKGARDLARLYLMVIASGFRGKFRVPNVRRPLAEYRRRLYEYAHQQDPLALYERDRRILPEAADHTLASRAVGRFTSAQKWIAAVLILMVLYIGISHFAWTRLSADLKDIMSRIENTDATGRTP